MMDFTTRPVQSPNTNRFASADSQQKPEENDDRSKNDKPKNKSPHSGSGGWNLWVKIWSVIFLLCLAALIVALLLSLGLGKQDNLSKYVDTSAYQAVEVMPSTSKPVYYFGNIVSINDNYLVLNNATRLTSEPNSRDVTVAPLNCVSANDSSQLVINLAQVVMWDNLAADSQAVKAITQQASGTCPVADNSLDRKSVSQPTNPKPTKPSSSETTTNDQTSPSTSQSTTTPGSITPSTGTNSTTNTSTGTAPTTP